MAGVEKWGDGGMRVGTEEGKRSGKSALERDVVGISEGALEREAVGVSGEGGSVGEVGGDGGKLKETDGVGTVAKEVGGGRV